MEIRNSYIIIAITIILTIIIIVYRYKTYKPIITSPPKNTLSPSVLDNLLSISTKAPKITTKYPLTEQAIMLTFPGNYSTPYSLNIFNTLLNNNINRDVLAKYNWNPFDLNCYVLHTPVFLPNPFKRQGGYYDNQNGTIVNNLTENESYYDIMGAYFFTNFYNLLGDNSYKPEYYDTIKQIVIDREPLIKIFSNLRADNSYNQFMFFTEGEIPEPLDDFVPRISMFLFYGLGVNSSSRYVYKNMLDKCK